MSGESKRHANKPGKKQTAEQLVEEFLALAEQQYAAYDIDDYKTSGRAVRRSLALYKELDEIPPAGRTVLAPFLDHPNLAVRVKAATALCLIMPDRALPVLRKIEGMRTREELAQPHALNAKFHASNTIFIYELGQLKI